MADNIARIEEINEQLKGWQREYYNLYQTAKQCGNKHPEDNFFIQQRIKIIEKLKAEKAILQQNC